MDASPSFSLFNNLPSELRINIWKCMFPQPRVVSIRYNRVAKQYTSTTAPPILLHICSESRAIFLSTYTNLLLSPNYPSSVFVNFACDTVFFDTLDCSPNGDLGNDLALSAHNDRILSCAIDIQLWEVLRVFRYDSLSEINWMKNLKMIALVMPREGRLHKRPTDGGGGGSVVIDVNTHALTAEVRHGLWYVDCLRKELEEEEEREIWANGTPNVQMWLW